MFHSHGMIFTFQKMTQAHFNFEHELRPPDDYSDLSVFSSPSVTQDVLPHEEVSPPHSLTPQQDEVSPEIPSPSLTSDVLQIEEVSPVSLDDETIPDHSFETKIIKGKLGAMKGKTRETVSLIIGNHIFRKRNSLKNRTISINKIYEEVRLSFTGNLDGDGKLLFLQKFPPLRNIAPLLYKRRRDHIPTSN